MSLRDELMKLGLVQVDTVTDGNCFFDALRIMLQLDKTVQEIREEVVETIPKLFGQRIQDKNPDTGKSTMSNFNDLINGTDYNSWEDYLENMKKDKTWGDDPCLWAASLKYKVKILVVNDNQDTQGNRVIDIIPSWNSGSSNKEITIGNYDQIHFVATKPDVPELPEPEIAKVEAYEKYTHTYGLSDMYKKTFTFDNKIVNTDEVLVNEDVVNKIWTNIMKKETKFGAAREMIQRSSITSEEDQLKVFHTIRSTMQAMKKNNTTMTNKKNILSAMILKDFNKSKTNWENYKKSYTFVSLIVSYFIEEGSKVVVDEEKKRRLLKIIHMAIKVGLNYQQISPLEMKFLPEKYELDDNDLATYFKGKIAPDIQKVSVQDLKNDPYWENIKIEPDLGDYISIPALSKVMAPVNMVKRTTLHKIYSVNSDYSLDLDNATPTQLKKLCSLNTLNYAHELHMEASRFFDTGEGDMDSAYTRWIRSDESFKRSKYKANDNEDFLTIPDIKGDDPDMDAILQGDFSSLPGLISTVVPSDPLKENAKDPITLIESNPDTKYAEKLSNALINIGFLPKGFDMYCRVKNGILSPRKRKNDSGIGSPTKRQREKLFTPLVYSKC